MNNESAVLDHPSPQRHQDDLKQHPVIILDFGSQYTQLIARRIREMHVYCEVHPYDVSLEAVEPLSPCGIILSGGPASVTVHTNPRAPDWVFTHGVPVLGICYGMQTMAVQLGGRVESFGVSEFGHALVQPVSHTRLFDGIAHREAFDVWMSHGDCVSQLPPNFINIAQTKDTPMAGMADEARQFYGVQFHPEVTHTSVGREILSQFVLNICSASTCWTIEHIAEHMMMDLRETVGDDGVLLGLSGGVDSSVVAALLHRAIGRQLVCVFVDHGLLRLNEASHVIEMFQDHLQIHLIVVNAQERFISALKGVHDPEEKRKIIGRVFIEVFDEEAAQLPHVKWLAQGTIYPDVIESAAHKGQGASAVIKSHHNVGGLPEHMALRLLEPLRALFKDEVRQLGLQLNLPYDMVHRHPFPGPGLGVRILGEIKPAYITILQQADAIFIEELHRADLYYAVSQAFAVFLPVKSVGVTGDARRYAYVICLRAVETTDFMTAHWSHLPWDFLAKVSNRIMNEVAGISRVSYDISGKPPATIEWE